MHQGARPVKDKPLDCIGSGGRTRTCDKAINSRLLYQLSYAGSGYRGKGQTLHGSDYVPMEGHIANRLTDDQFFPLPE